MSVIPGIKQVTLLPTRALSTLKPLTVTLASICLLCHVLLKHPVTTDCHSQR